MAVAMSTKGRTTSCVLELRATEDTVGKSLVSGHHFGCGKKPSGIATSWLGLTNAGMFRKKGHCH